MQVASFTGFIKTLVLFIVIYWGFKLFFKFFGPLLFQQLTKRMEHRFKEQQNRHNNEGTSFYTKNNTTSKTKSKKPKETKKIGEYIDYEDIE